MEEQLELQKQFRQQQEKFTYYVIALAVTAIGFSVFRTSTEELKLIQLPLAFSVLSWGLSIYFGLNLLKQTSRGLYVNNEYFTVIQGQSQKVGTHPDRIEAALKGLNQAVESIQTKSILYAKLQENLFYSGMVLFLVWHILGMSSLSK